MQNFENKKDRIIVLAFWFAFFLPMVCFSISLLAWRNAFTITFAIITFIGTIFFTRLIGLVSKGFFLKYIFQAKKFKAQYNESIKKFNGASEAFLKELKTRTRNQFMICGNIYYHQTIDDDKWILSDKDNLQGLKWLIDFLDTSIKEKTGFNSFIDRSFSLTHNGELSFYTLNNGFLSGELKYLLLKVYEETGFNLEDNGLSLEYTNQINAKRNLLDREYSPLLYNFKDEVSLLKDKFAIKIELNIDEINQNLS